MTRILYDPVTLSLSAEGHAGYAEYGKDIVCAGISALIFALPAALEQHGIAYQIDTDRGYVSIKAKPAINYRYVCHIILSTTMVGLKNIQNEYPEYISITIKESEEE